MIKNEELFFGKREVVMKYLQLKLIYYIVVGLIICGPLAYFSVKSGSPKDVSCTVVTTILYVIIAYAMYQMNKCMEEGHERHRQRNRVTRNHGRSNNRGGGGA